MIRRKTRKIRLGNMFIGGDSEVSVQSMTNTDTRDIDKTVRQIKRLENAGCDIVRCAVPDMEACDALETIVKKSQIPVVADVHFDYRLALKSIDNGVSGLRINPGNIGGMDRVLKVAKSAGEHDIPIRVGVNSGSLGKDLLKKYGKVCSDALVESAMNHVSMLEEAGFYNIVISIKSSNVAQMIESYRKISNMTQYPLHLGVTEAGTRFTGTVKSSIGIGTLLMDGIGDTIRVSLTGDPEEEVHVGCEILKDCGLRRGGIDIVSCPTCGRTEIDLIGIAHEVEKQIHGIKKDIKVAIMGCVVNGPGEAREADIGIAGGNGEGLIFKKGKIIKKVPENDLVKSLVEEIKSM
jgi:(E)-4-hydroxy-3-methylbut-2-enyl-diphosphate synthase